MSDTGNTIINIPPGFTGTVTINHITGATTVSSSAPAVASTPAGPAYFSPGVEDLLKRHKSYDPRTRSREMAEFLRDQGWIVHEHKRYARFVYPGDEYEVTLYLSSKDLVLRKHEELIKDRDDVTLSGSGVRIDINGDQFENAKGIVMALESLANG